MIYYLIGVHQGANLAPLLFIIIFQATMESLELTDKQQTIMTPSYSYFPDMDKGKLRGRMTG